MGGGSGGKLLGWGTQVQRASGMMYRPPRFRAWTHLQWPAAWLASHGCAQSIGACPAAQQGPAARMRHGLLLVMRCITQACATLQLAPPAPPGAGPQTGTASCPGPAPDRRGGAGARGGGGEVSCRGGAHVVGQRQGGQYCRAVWRRPASGLCHSRCSELAASWTAGWYGCRVCAAPG